MDNQEWLDEIDKKIEEEKRNYRGPHCCMTMHYSLLSDANVLDYDSKYREYGVKIPKSTRVMLMDYCMFCGKKLPLSLRDEWFNILEKEYGLERPVTADRKRVPQEFWTDKWWKKRKL